MKKRGDGSTTVIEVLMMAHEGEAPYRVAVEPWGGEFAVEPGAPVRLSFDGQSVAMPPMIAVVSSGSRVEIWAERGIDDFTVHGVGGAELVAE